MTNNGVLRWGRLTKADISNPFTASRFDALSFTTTPIAIYATEKLLGHATGFYWRQEDSCYLITNWHVVTGNDPFTGRVLQAAQPSHLIAYDIEWSSSDGAYFTPNRTSRRIDLFDSDLIPIWKQHFRFGEYRTDVVAIPLEGWHASRKQRHIVCVNEYGFEELPHFAGSELFVVGYPLASFDGWMLPLWKRGSFASEPLMPVDDKPIFLIDVASSEGMSGSPVFRRVFGPSPSADCSGVNLVSIKTTQFAGVYAGRLHSSDFERVGMGYVWYGNVVEEIISGGTAGTTA